MPVGDILVGFVTSLLYDLAKTFFKQKKDTQTDIEDYIRNKSDRCEIEQDLSDVVVAFLQQPQAADMVRDYSMYLLTGRQRQAGANGAKATRPLDEKMVLDYLVREFLKAKRDALPHYDEGQVRAHFAFVFTCVDGYLLMGLSDSEKAQILIAQRRTSYNFSLLMQRVDELGEDIRRMTAIKLQAESETYEELRQRYMQILCDRFSKAHIHMIAQELEFNDFYVPQRLWHLPLAGSSVPFASIEVKSPSMEPAASQDVLDAPDIVPPSHGRPRGIPVHWKNIFTVNNLVYIIGGAGYGKSLFLQNIINNYPRLNIPDSDGHLVVLVDLKDFYPPGQNTPRSVVEVIRESIQASTLLEKSLYDVSFVEHYLKKGRFVLLLDALDEVEGSRRKALHEMLIAFFRQTNPKNKICITSRERGFIPQKQIDAFRILPLDRLQVEHYVNNLIDLGLFDRESQEEFLRQTGDLRSKGFLNSFLVLALLINIFKAERTLPVNKLDLYEKCVSYISNLREQEKMVAAYDFRTIGPLIKDNTFIELARLAYPNNRQATRAELCDFLVDIYKKRFASEMDAENAVEAFLAFCADRTELYVMQEENRYKFFHRSFFEYFYAQYIAFRCRDAGQQYRELLRFDTDSEVFELTAALLKQKNEHNYQELLTLMLERMADKDTQTEELVQCFNAFLLMLPVVDDVFYRDQFFRLLLEDKRILFYHDKQIASKNMLGNFILTNDEYFQAFVDSYFVGAVCDMVLNLFDDPDVAERLLQETGKRDRPPPKRDSLSSTVSTMAIWMVAMYTDLVLLHAQKSKKLMEIVFWEAPLFGRWLRENLASVSKRGEVMEAIRNRETLSPELFQHLQTSLQKDLADAYGEDNLFFL